MNYKTHMATGLTTAAYFVFHNNVKSPLAFSILLLTGAVAGTLADIDQPHSLAGQRTPIISHVTGAFFSHRTFTHSLFFVGLLWYVLEFHLNFPALYEKVFLYSYISHLVVDMFNPQGLMLFWPIRTWIRLPALLTFQVNSFLEEFLFYPLLVVYYGLMTFGLILKPFLFKLGISF